jgi:hypothetical protein
MALPENNIEIGKILKDYNGPELRSTQLFSGFGDPVGNAQWNPTSLPLDSPSTSGSGDMRERKRYAPFTPHLRGSSGSYEVALSRGNLIECIVPTPSPVLNYYKTKTHEVGVDGNEDYVWHAMTVGQSLYLNVNVLATGRIDRTINNALSFTVADTVAATLSPHYYPQIGNYAGAAGLHVYRMLDLVAAGSGAKVVEHACGSHLFHYDERVTMQNTVGVAGDVVSYEVLYTYDPATDTIKYRTLSQIAVPAIGQPLIDSATASDIKFRRIDGRPAGDTPARQINVVAGAAANGVIVVQGNGKSGSLVVTNCDGASTTLLTWVDGLITSDSITFTAGCSTSTPP